MRIAVVGARCRRQGIGAHLARFCHEAGAEVRAVYGTSPSSAAEAAGAFARTPGAAAPEAFHDAGALLETPGLEALVIAAPHEAHEAWLQHALEHGLHVLCEKPLVWGGPHPDLRAEELSRAFLARGLHLAVVTQWPYTLSTYRRLFPEVAQWPAEFHMRLSPSSRGTAMFLDSLSHPLSLLASVLPDPEAEICDARAVLEEEGLEGRMRFGYRSGDHTIHCRVELACMPQPPREAAYGFDGCVATRQLELPAYRMQLADAQDPARRIPLPDPTPLLVGSFLRAVREGRPPVIDPAAIPGMRHLVHLMETVARALESPDPART